MNDRIDLSSNKGLQEPALLRILNAIKDAGGEARPVGGAVRDVLLGRKVGEVDIAVNLEPEKVIEILSKAGIKTVPTGIDHGTITAVVDHKGYELTSLRRDIETDGRHAKVSFTKDWKEDASRRDFTMNALYVDEQGNLYDYFGGREDLAQGRVRFIGDAHERIKEDVLRILRFFRFYAWFGRGAIDQAGLEACTQMASLLPQLSVERVWREIGKLLNAPAPHDTWRLMLECNVLKQILPEAADIKKLESLLAVETKYEIAPSYLVRLASLLPKDAALAGKIAQRLKMSNREADYLNAVVVLQEQVKGKLDPVPFRRMIYLYDAQPMRDAALLYVAGQPEADIEDALTLAASWQKAIFPVQGQDILQFGVKTGPKVGEILKATEEWWIADDFHADREACLKYASNLARK